MFTINRSAERQRERVLCLGLIAFAFLSANASSKSVEIRTGDCSRYIKGKIQEISERLNSPSSRPDRRNSLAEPLSEREAALAKSDEISDQADREQLIPLASLQTRTSYLVGGKETQLELVETDAIIADLKKVSTRLKRILLNTEEDLEPESRAHAQLLVEFLKNFEKKRKSWLVDKVNEHKKLLLSEGNSLGDFLGVLLDDFVQEKGLKPQVEEKDKSFILFRWFSKAVKRPKGYWKERTQRRIDNALIDSSTALPATLTEEVIRMTIFAVLILPIMNNMTQSTIRDALAESEARTEQVQQLFKLEAEQLEAAIDILDNANKTFRRLQKTSSKDGDELWAAFEKHYIEVAQRLATLSSSGSTDPQVASASVFIEGYEDTTSTLAASTGAMSEEEQSETYARALARRLFVGSVFRGESMTAYELHTYLDQVEDFERFNQTFTTQASIIADTMRSSLGNVSFSVAQ